MPRALLTILILYIISCPLVAQEAASLLRRQLQAQGNPEYPAASVTLLPSAQEKYDHLFQAIAGAERYIHLEYFKLLNDSTGHTLMRLLGQKAREGVEVRVLLDDMANRRARRPWSRQRMDSLRNAGIHIATFDPFTFPWVNHIFHRDHRKIVVVDGRLAYTGGMNVGDYYLTGTARSGPWRDMHICLQGPVVGEFQDIFARLWQRVAGESLDSLRYASPPATSADTIPLVIVNREPGRLSKRMRQAFVEAIDGAQHEIRIVNPYLTNVRSVRRAMRRALERGVRLRIMVSGSSDVRITPDVMAIEMKKLMERGAEVYYYDAGFHHSKTMTVDGTHCTVGTANLDGRSMLFDYEINAFIFSPAVTARLDSIFDADLRHSQLLTPQNFRQRFSLGRRMTGRLFTPVRSVF